MRRVNGSDNPGEDHLKSNKGLSVPLTNRSSTIRALVFSRSKSANPRPRFWGAEKESSESRAPTLAL